MENDIFKDLQEVMGCEYISDIRMCGKRIWIWKFMKKLELERYSLHELCNLAEYVYDEKIKFDSYEQVRSFFSTKRS